jgi:hypothetical protein
VTIDASIMTEMPTALQVFVLPSSRDHPYPIVGFCLMGPANLAPFKRGGKGSRQMRARGIVRAALRVRSAVAGMSCMRCGRMRPLRPLRMKVAATGARGPLRMKLAVTGTRGPLRTKAAVMDDGGRSG